MLFVLEPRDGKRLATQMIGGTDGEQGGFSAMEQSALQEIGNILTSGFIDGWANVLDATIDMTTPTLVVDDTTAIIDQMGGWPDSDPVFVIDSNIVSEGDRRKPSERASGESEALRASNASGGSREQRPASSEGAAIDLTVYTFPQLEDLVDLIQDIDLDTDVEADTTADKPL